MEGSGRKLVMQGSAAGTWRGMRTALAPETQLAFGMRMRMTRMMMRMTRMRMRMTRRRMRSMRMRRMRMMRMRMR